VARSGYLRDDLLVGGGLELVGGQVAQGAVQPGAVVPGDVGHGGAAGGRSGGSGPLAPRLSYTAVRRDSPNTQGTIGTFLTYDEAVAAARDYVLRW
jgi:hypothetical protein